MNTWSSVTKAKFQNPFVLSFFFLITFLSLMLILSNNAKVYSIKYIFATKQFDESLL